MKAGDFHLPRTAPAGVSRLPGIHSAGLQQAKPTRRRCHVRSGLGYLSGNVSIYSSDTLINTTYPTYGNVSIQAGSTSRSGLTFYQVAGCFYHTGTADADLWRRDWRNHLGDEERIRGDRGHERKTTMW